MRTQFKNAVIKRAELFAEKALVVTLGFQPVTHLDRTVSQAKDVRDKFIEYLRQSKRPHKIVFKDDHSLSFAVSKEPVNGEPVEIRAFVKKFFEQNDLQAALACQAYYQQQDKNPDMTQYKYKPFKRVCREVKKQAKRQP